MKKEVLIITLVAFTLITGCSKDCNWENPELCGRFCETDKDCRESCCGCVNVDEGCDAPYDLKCERIYCKCENNACQIDIDRMQYE